MGTNFYCRKINQHKRKELLDKFDQLHKDLVASIEHPSMDYKSILNNFLWENDSREDEIHLGKRSAGWQFLWDYHDGRYFEPTLKSIRKFLSQPDMVIYNEYGRTLTVEQFLEDEVKDWLYKTDKLKDGSEDNYLYWWKYYFISDGLRFAKFENFS